MNSGRYGPVVYWRCPRCDKPPPDDGYSWRGRLIYANDGVTDLGNPCLKCGAPRETTPVPEEELPGYTTVEEQRERVRDWNKRQSAAGG